MKLKKYTQICLTAIILTGCNSLDITNTTSFDAERVWNDEKLATAYLTNLYPVVFGNWNYSADNISEQINNIIGENAVTITNGTFKCWKYTSIRKINEGLQSLDASSLDATCKISLKSQLLFLRAYEYFQMVMYHGGVPIIKVPQDKDRDDLYVPRSSTKDCFDFIIGDIDEAITGLPESIDGSSADYGRIDQCFARAFKAKVLLYKASPQFNPSHPYDNGYIGEAYDAAKEAYDFCKNHGKALTPDYNDIWLKEKGSEVIFAVVNEYPNKVASWDNGTRPGSESRSNTSANPTWEMAKAFPMADGKKWNDHTGKYYKTDNDSIFAQHYWENRDPRFANCLAINGSIYELSGKKGRRQYTSLGIAVSDDSFGYNPNAGVVATHNETHTGQFIRKIQKISLTQAEVSSHYDVDFILMRFAEVMLIYAEMANEYGKTDVALDMLRQIRKRAGIEPGNNNEYGIVTTTDRAIIREAILDERAVELCFEGHRFWDLRRTRNLVDRLNGLNKHGIEAIPYDKQQKKDMDLNTAYELSKSYSLTSEDFRYVIHQVPKVGNTTMVMKDSYYFFPIQQSHIDSNPKIKQNKDWGGDFNPALD